MKNQQLNIEYYKFENDPLINRQIFLIRLFSFEVFEIEDWRRVLSLRHNNLVRLVTFSSSFFQTVSTCM